MIRAATVAAGNGVAGARLLARALAEHHPEWELTVLVLPGLRPALHPEEEPFALLAPQDLSPRGDALPPGAPAELRAALARPLLVRHLLGAGADAVVLLPADAEVDGPLDALEAALAEHPAVLVPRLLGPLPADGEHPDAQDLLEAGEIDDELVAVRGDDAGRAFADWWAERASEAAEAAAGLGEDAPGVVSRLAASPLGPALRAFEGLARLEDPAYDVSFWNLHERGLAGARLVRFAGFRADRPWWLSEHASRTLVLDDPALTERCAARARALLEAGWIPDAEGGGSGRELPNGLVWNERLRRLHAQALDAGEDFGDVYAEDGARAFAAWLNEPADVGAAAGVTRYALDVWRERRDVRQVFRDLDGDDGEGFVAWLWRDGRRELGLEEGLLPPRPDSVPPDAEHVPPVLVTGYLRGHLGLGEAARGYTAALQAAGVPVATATLVPDSPGEKERAFEDVALPDGSEPEVNLLAVQAYQVPELAREAGEEHLRSRHTIGVWAWETDKVPPWWDPAFDLVDEVWVNSRYIAENLGRATDVDVPVVVVPPPVRAPDPAGATVPFALPDGFVFLFAFDFLSTLQRKNPLGLLEAFQAAFAPGEGPTLLLKTINAGYRPQERERLRHAIGARDDIVIADATLEPGEMAALFARADCYVSLHRAEGFGLTLAESMALGKPVIGTGYSGNTDFMTPANSYLVDWRLTEVGPDAEHYPADGTWAEPSVEHAAALMREVWEDQDAARARGARAAADVAAALSPAAVGAIARNRLVRIGRRRPAHAAAASEAPPAPAGLELDHRLAFDLGGGDGGGGARTLARRTLFRALRPYTASERKLDEALADAIRRLHLELERERSTRGRDLARTARIEDRIAELKDATAALARGQEDLRGRLELLERAGPAGEGDAAAAARARPYMAGDGLVPFEHDHAGRVLGFRGAAGEPRPEEEVYRRFEEVFRGPRERVAGLVEPYVALLEGHGPVLDVGAGRGELIERLRDAGVEARGVDADAGMAAEARARGLELAVGDGIEHLAGLEDRALGAVTAIHVIEHLPAEALVRFFRVARAKLRPGGLLVAETVNPHAAHALKTFWVDPTHQHPVFPEVALTLAEAAGFREGFLWHPRGSRDAERDLFREDAYAVVAVA